MANHYHHEHNTVVRRSRTPISPIPKRKDPQAKLHGNTGENNGMWKGDNVGYGSLHDWVRYHLPRTKLCQLCNKEPPYDLANISGEYRRDLNDYQWLCRRCHMKSDGRYYAKDQETGRFVSREQLPLTPIISTQQ